MFTHTKKALLKTDVNNFLGLIKWASWPKVQGLTALSLRMSEHPYEHYTLPYVNGFVEKISSTSFTL